MASVGEITVELNLDASKLTSGLKSAMGQLDSFANKAKSVETSLSGMGQGIGSKLSSAFKNIGTAALVTGAAAATAAVGGLALGADKAIQTFGNFETSVAQAASVTGKTGEAFDQAKASISEVAQQLGADTVFSAQEAADAMYTLASAGVDVTNMSANQLKPALDLAAGSQTDLSSTMDTMVAVSSQFGISFEDNARIADVFATSIGQSQATMEKLAYSFNYVGPVANAAGMSLEKTTAALDVLYDNGLKGQQAGTGLRGVIASLANPTDKAAAVLKSLGLTVEDVNPATNDLGTVMGKLQEKGMTTAQAFTLFNRTAAPAALILAKNSAAIGEYTTQLEGAAGSAGTIASQQMDTLEGSLERMRGDIENLFIGVGEALSPMVRQIASEVENIMPTIQEFAVGAATAFANFVLQLGPTAEAIGNIITTIGDTLSGVFKAVSGTDMGSGLADMINGIMERISGIIMEFAPTIQNAMVAVIQGIQSVFAQLGPSVENLKTVISSVITIITTLWGVISSGGSGASASSGIAAVVNTITSILAGFSTKIASIVVAVAPTLQAVFTAIVGAFTTFASNFDGIKANIEAKFAALQMVFGQLAQKLKPAWDAVVAAFQAGLAAVSDATGGSSGIWDKLKQVWDELPTILNDAINKLNPVWNALNAAFIFASGVIQGFIANIGLHGII